MTFYRLAPAVPCALLAAVLAFACPADCLAQETTRKQAGTAYGLRMDAFRRLLFEFRFQPLERPADLLAEPSKSILIVLGDTDCLSNGYFPEGLASFVRSGGAVLIATDREIINVQGREEVSRLAGVRVTGEKLHAPSGAEVYAEDSFCPFVQPIAAAPRRGGSTNVLAALAAVVGAGKRPDLFRDPRPDQPSLRVASNVPSRLQEGSWGLPGGIHRLARLPAGCMSDSLDRPPSMRRRGTEPLLFAVGGAVGEGRILVLADHSLFINRMMLYRDNNNLEFTANCLHWLRGGTTNPLDALGATGNPQALQQLVGQRDRVLFFEDGTVRKDFEVPLRSVPLKPSIDMEPAIVAAIDQTVANLEGRDALNRGLLDWIDDQPGGLPRVKRNILYVLTLAIALLLGYIVLWRGRFRSEAGVPALAHVLSQHEPRAELLELRRRAMRRSGNVWEVVHRLARQYFESAGIPLTASAAPRVAVQGGWWQRRRLRRRVTRLWQLARGTAPRRIPAAALPLWLRDLNELKTALAKGTIEFQKDEG